MESELVFAQHPPMYLYHFLQSLLPLTDCYVPECIDLGANTVIFAWVDRNTAQEYIKALPPQGRHFLLYAQKNDLHSLSFMDVSRHVQYLHDLTTSIPVPFDDDDYSLLRAALFEAVGLFGLLASLALPQTFAPLGGFAELAAVYSDNRLRPSGLPVLAQFDNNPLTLQIFVAQTKFFFAKYLEHRFYDYALTLAPPSVAKDFDKLVYGEIAKIQGKTCCKSRDFTGVDNPEYDAFIQQLDSLIAFHPEKLRHLLGPYITEQGKEKTMEKPSAPRAGG